MVKKLMAMLLAVMLLATMCWTGLAVSAEDGVVTAPETAPIAAQDSLAVTTDITPLSDKSVGNFTADVDYTVKADQTASVTFDMDDSDWQTEYFCDFNNGEVWTSAAETNAMSNTGNALVFVGKKVNNSAWFAADPIVENVGDFELTFDVVSLGHTYTNANFYMRNQQYVMFICGNSAAPTIDGKKSYLYFQNRDTGEKLGYNGTVAGKTVRVVSIGKRVEIYVGGELAIDYYPTRPFTLKTGSIYATVTECAITYDNVKVSVPRESYGGKNDAYYKVSLGQTVALNRVEGGVSTAIATSDVALDIDKAYDFRIVRNNASVKVTANGITVLETADVAVGSGIVGICASAEDTIDSIDLYDSASMYIADSVYDPVLIQDGVSQSSYISQQGDDKAYYPDGHEYALATLTLNSEKGFALVPKAGNANPKATVSDIIEPSVQTKSNIKITFEVKANLTNWVWTEYIFAGYKLKIGRSNVTSYVSIVKPDNTEVKTEFETTMDDWRSVELEKIGNTVNFYYNAVGAERTLVFTETGSAQNYINFTFWARQNATFTIKNFKVYELTPDTNDEPVIQSGISRDTFISNPTAPKDAANAAKIEINGDDAKLWPATDVNNAEAMFDSILEDGVGLGDIKIKFGVNQNRKNWTSSRIYFAGYNIFLYCGNDSTKSITITNPVGKEVAADGTLFVAPADITTTIELVKIGKTLTVYYYPENGTRTEMFTESGYALYNADFSIWHKQTSGLTVKDFTVYDLTDKTAGTVKQLPIEDAVKDTLEITSQGSNKNAVNTVHYDSYFTLKSSTEQNGIVTSNNILKNSYANAHIKFNVTGGVQWCEERFIIAGYTLTLGISANGTAGWAPSVTPNGKSAVSIPSVGDTTLAFHKGTPYTVEIIKYGSNISFYYYPVGGERLCIYTDNNATETANLSIYVRQQTLAVKDFKVYDVVTDETVVFPATNLVDEIATADAGDVITLHSDVAVDSTIAIDKAVTLDLNGYKVISTVADGYLFDVNADLTVKNGIIDIMDGKSFGVIAINSAATVTVENARIYGNTAGASVIRNAAEGATLTLTNTNIGTNNYAVDGEAFADIAISGGNYRSTSNAIKAIVSGEFVLDGTEVHARYGAVEALGSGETTVTNTVIADTEANNTSNHFALAVGDGMSAVIESGYIDAYHPNKGENLGYALKINETGGTITINGGTITDGYMAPATDDDMLYINIACSYTRFDANANYTVAEGLASKYVGTTLTVAVNETIADITGDGFIGADDVIYIRKDLLGVIDSTDYYDVTGDGVVNILDLIRIKKYAATAALGYATVTSLSGGKVQNNTSPDVDLVISNATIYYSEADEAVGRAAGYYIGANIYAPANATAETLAKATYSKRLSSSASESGWTDYTTGISFWNNKDTADDAEKHYTSVWVGTTPELLEKYAGLGMNIAAEYVFDWDGDGKDEQTITVSIAAGDGIVLVPAQ